MNSIDLSFDIARWSPSALAAIAIATTWLLAAIAVAKGAISRRRRRPDVSFMWISMRESETFLALGGGTLGVGPRAAYARLLVSNEQRRDPAEETHVVVVTVQQVNPPTADEPLEIRMPLAWTHSDPTVSLTTLHGGSPRFIDLVAVHDGHRDASLLTHPRAAPPTGTLEPALDAAQNPVATTWELDLELVARHLDPRRTSVLIKWDGAWTGSALDKHLSVNWK